MFVRPSCGQVAIVEIVLLLRQFDLLFIYSVILHARIIMVIVIPSERFVGSLILEIIVVFLIRVPASVLKIVIVAVAVLLLNSF